MRNSFCWTLWDLVLRIFVLSKNMSIDKQSLLVPADLDGKNLLTERFNTCAANSTFITEYGVNWSVQNLFLGRYGEYLEYIYLLRINQQYDFKAKTLIHSTYNKYFFY